MSIVLITGSSKGIGLALADKYLQRGWKVIGISREMSTLSNREGYFHLNYDLSNVIDLKQNLIRFLNINKIIEIEHVILNAGNLGISPAPTSEFNLSNINEILNTNAISNKVILDLLMSMNKCPGKIFVSSSIASQRYREGMLGYSMSKALLNAIVGVYAKEYPDTFFYCVGLCNVKTNLSNKIINSDNTEKFEALKGFKNRALNDDLYLVSPDERADNILDIIDNTQKYNVESGQFIEIRSLNIKKKEAK